MWRELRNYLHSMDSTPAYMHGLPRLQESTESGSKVSAYRRWLKVVNRDKRCIATHIKLVSIEFVERSD